jgi:hypothetical protein
MVKLGKAKDHKGVIVDVTKTCDKIEVYLIKVNFYYGQQIIGNIDLSTIIPIVNITNLGMISYYCKNYIFCPCLFGLLPCLLFLF